MSNRVHQLRVVVTAEDYDDALHFYRDVLGLPEREAFAWAPGSRPLGLVRLAEDTWGEGAASSAPSSRNTRRALVGEHLGRFAPLGRTRWPCGRQHEQRLAGRSLGHAGNAARSRSIVCTSQPFDSARISVEYGGTRRCRPPVGCPTERPFLPGRNPGAQASAVGEGRSNLTAGGHSMKRLIIGGAAVVAVVIVVVVATMLGGGGGGGSFGY
jgi:catechol 2,3-dioxygenase-like lactoylglutathione lyase family enzyme